MVNVLKKVLMVLCIFVIASVLFSGPTNEVSTSSASEVVEIIDGNSSELRDGYVEVPTSPPAQSKNVFVTIIEVISGLINSLFSALFNLISGLVSGFAKS